MTISNPYPLVVIGLPVYNGEKGISRAVHSILNQTYKNIRLLILDNCSTDKTGEIVSKLSAEDTRITYQRNSINIGMIENFNLVKDLAIEMRPEYFTWASHDDYYSPDFIQRCLDILSSDTEIALASGWCVAVSEGKELFVDKGADLLGSKIFDRFNAYRALVHRDGYIGGLFYGLYRVEQLLKVENMKHMIAADHLPLAEMCILGKFKVYPENLIYKSAGGASRSLNHLKSILKIKSYIGQNFPYFYRELEFQRLLRKHTIPLCQKCLLKLFSILLFIKFTVIRDNYRIYRHKLKKILIRA